MRLKARTLFTRMWHTLVGLMLASFVVNAVLVTATLQLGSEAQTERRLARIGEYWASQVPATEPVQIDPVTFFYPRYELLPPEIRAMLGSGERGIFELGPRARDYFVLAHQEAAGEPFYVVENHSEVKPQETLEWQVFSWYAMGIIPFTGLLLWLCARGARRIAAPLAQIGMQVDARPPQSLEPLPLPEGAPRELAVLVGQLNSAFQRTADVLERERNFARFASHELRTPAAVMQAVLERLADGASERQHTALQRGERALRDMNALIETFLKLSLEAGGAGATAAATVVVDQAWVAELFTHFYGPEKAGRIAVKELAPLCLAAPETVLHVLIGNLLKNAVVHGGEPPIAVTLSATAITVENTLGACAAEGASAATPDKPVSPGITSGAQGATLGLSVLPSDPRFSDVSLRCLLPRTLLAPEPQQGFGLGCLISQRICDRFGWTFVLQIGPQSALARVSVPAPAPLR
ncbi:HAMP domain-containing sensor histidine kinase [Acidovorax sp.]|uniref:HAMP domain-containing sensor histidine kinase n=1 Tax=Acidovorax sp. TaxID=1872122 RepID=UPI002ACD8990|nr:HAMP domain-containing sensor histidine kinase [Acidovorax sp.]MDZ7862946.1 HAMP domain-containing sensor histidine kinase [Acidovorax sp.]